MTAQISKETLLEVWRRDMDSGYTQPIEESDEGRGLDPIAGLAAMFERVSRAVVDSIGAVYLKPHSQQDAPPASGAVLATGTADVYRRNVLGGAVDLDDGDVIIAHFLGVNGEDVDAPAFEVVGDWAIPAGTEGPTSIQIRAVRPGPQNEVPNGTPAVFAPRRGGDYDVVSFSTGTELVTIDPATGDRFVPTMVGMFWRFTSGPNTGAPARRIVAFLAEDQVQIDNVAGLVTQGTGTGVVLSIQEVGDFDIVLHGIDGGRSAELDFYAHERTSSERAVDETDDEYRRRITVIPDAVSPNAMVRAIAGVLDPAGVPFQYIEVFETDTGFFFSGSTGPTTTDSAWTDPFAYRNRMFYSGEGANGVAIGFLVVINGLALPVEPDLTKILSALTATIIATKGGGVPWAIAFEPPIPPSMA